MGDWERRWKMEFYPQKCCAMHMTRKRKTLEHTYQLHGHDLQRETSVRYLGMTITSDLKWDSHINNTVNKANRVLGFLRRTLKISDVRLKSTAYKALVKPILEYLCAV